MKTGEGISSWYQIELTRENALDVVTLKVEPAAGFDLDNMAKMETMSKEIQAKCKSALSVGIKVKIVEPYAIPRSEGKAKRIVDNR